MAQRVRETAEHDGGDNESPEICPCRAKSAKAAIGAGGAEREKEGSKKRGEHQRVQTESRGIPLCDGFLSRVVDAPRNFRGIYESQESQGET